MKTQVLRWLSLLALVLSPKTSFCQESTWQTIPTDSLTEWSDPGDWWKTENGVIVADSKGGKKLPKFHYIVWNGSVKGDFELSLEYRILNAKKPEDSGVCFRVERPAGKEPNLRCYQAELDTATQFADTIKNKGSADRIRKGKLFGHIHDGKRTKMIQRSNTLTIKADGTEQITPFPASKAFDPAKVYRNPPEWNQCRIRVEGERIQLFLNDVLANELVDQDPKNRANGDGIALQYRPVNSYRFEVRELKCRPLQ